MSSLTPKVEIYDTTLRDGSQQVGLDLTVSDKLRVAGVLDGLGVDVIEGGWPGSNPKDAEFFERAKSLNFKNAQLAAFGATRLPRRGVDDDANLAALLAADTPIVTLVGKAWTLHVDEALRTTRDTVVGDHRRALVHFLGAPAAVLRDAAPEVRRVALPIDAGKRFGERVEHRFLDAMQARAEQALDEQRLHALDDDAAPELDRRDDAQRWRADFRFETERRQHRQHGFRMPAADQHRHADPVRRDRRHHG